MDYTVGKRLGLTAEPARRKRLLLLSLIANLGFLGFFKYANFFLESAVSVLNVLGFSIGIPHYDIILPPAISFFTFASMGYVLDVYYERVAPCSSASDYALFVTFFPKLLSGPIVRAADFLPQLKQRARAQAGDIEAGLARFLVGAIKKLVISDQIVGHVNMIFSAPSQYDRFTLMEGVIGYAIQLYCDFSGYSDMAIGSARILGINLPENFQMPFSALSITEFWRRWHITLSKWFRDYVFLPLEIATRNAFRPNVRVSVNIILMMLLCGLWHGPSWNFVIFGGIHGVALAAHKMWTVWNPIESLRKKGATKFLWLFCARLLTLGVVILGFVYFRAQSVADAGAYLKGLLFPGVDATRVASPYILMSFAAVFLFHLLLNKERNWVEEIPARSLPVRMAAYTCGLILLVFFSATEAAPFIYFQF
jgi:alginate O-acetyltransferase complex protein AlgI